MDEERRIRDRRMRKEERGRGEDGERMIGAEEGEGGRRVPSDVGSGNLNPGRRKGGKVVRRSVGKENKGEEDRG